MYTTYTLPNNKKIQGFFHVEWMKNSDIKYAFNRFEWRPYKEDNEHVEAEEHVADITFVEDVPTVTIYGFQINLLDFDYHCLPVLINEIDWSITHKDRWFVYDDVIWSSLVKAHDKFGVKIKLSKFDIIVPDLGIGIARCDESNQDEVLCVPRLNRRDITEWFYKIAFWAKDENLRQVYSGEEYYFQDFCSMLKSGFIKLIEL